MKKFEDVGGAIAREPVGGGDRLGDKEEALTLDEQELITKEKISELERESNNFFKKFDIILDSLSKVENLVSLSKLKNQDVGIDQEGLTQLSDWIEEMAYKISEAEKKLKNIEEIKEQMFNSGEDGLYAN